MNDWPLSNSPDLTACAREPIHIPGLIQPHGVLIATADGEQRISHISANFADSFGLTPQSALNTDLEALVGPGPSAAMHQALHDANYAPTNVLNLELPIPLRPQRKVLVHRCQGRMIVELEDMPGHDDTGTAFTKSQIIIDSLRRAQTVAQLCEEAARGIRRLTGYDRVMIYRFDETEDGTVVAEDKAAGIDSFLHLRYPASDIPVQARALYVLQRVRNIPDVNYRPVALQSAAARPLDMSFCNLRSVSPVHIEYLRNMGVGASFSISLLRGDVLWGLIACHHMVPLAPSADVRAQCDMIGQLMSMVLLHMAATEALASRLDRIAKIRALRNDIDASLDVIKGLCRQPEPLLSLMGASGALVRYGGDTKLVGDTPPRAASYAMVDALLDRRSGGIESVANAGQPDGVAASFAAAASGILVMPLTETPGDVIAWFRPEVTRAVRWAGDPNKAKVAEPDGPRLSPRKSFAAWTELRRGQSDPWSTEDIQAAEDLRGTITHALLHQAATQLAQLSAYDPLTGLANRRTMEAELKRWQRGDVSETAALLFFDLDRFKTINDTLGHEAGDDLLIEVAARLRHLAPEGSVPGRLGGDEFVLFWPGASSAAAEALADRLVKRYAAPFLFQGRNYHFGASIGVVCGTVADLGGMMRQADVAMYAAKRRGGGQAVVFRPELHADALKNRQTEQDLFDAVANGELDVQYQPLIRVADRRVYGFEALARWRHPVRGWVSPAEFIPIAEESGLIVQIGLWILSVAVRQIGVWRLVEPELTVSVNISPQQLRDRSLVQSAADVLAAAGVTPSAICLEVTERALMDKASTLVLEELRALGLTIALDDFGTGYSSLSHLQNLPIDIVKIDQSFIAPLGSSVTADRFFSVIVDLARTIRLRTVAEGCETAQHWRVIEAARCDVVQGYLLGRPMDAAAAGRFLTAPPDRPWDKPGASGATPLEGHFAGDGSAITINAEGLGSRDIFFAAFNMSRMSMTLVDPHQPDMPLVLVNEAFEHLTGYDRAEILGRNCRFLQGADSDSATIQKIGYALRARLPVSVEMVNYRKDGSSFRNAIRVSPVFDLSGRLVYFFGSQVGVHRRASD